MNKRMRNIIIIALTAIAFVGGVYFFNRGIERTSILANDNMVFAKAEVIEILSSSNESKDSSNTVGMAGSQSVRVKIKSGAHKGEECDAQNIKGYLYGADCRIGTKVILQLSEYENNISASIYGYDRGNILYILIGLFLIILCVIGGKKGFYSAIGLVFTFACILFIYIPMLYVGASPFVAAVLVVILITFVSMWLIGGFSMKTLCSIMGTIAGVIVAGGIALLFGKISNISGYNVDDIESMIYIGQNSKLQIGGLLFSGIIIASLGAVMDVSMSVASTINEIHDRNPELPPQELFKSGINVGKDMMGTMSNTLILAFAGTSINTMIVIYAYSLPYLQVINMYSIGIEILQGISGTIGVILTVPLVSAMSAWGMTKAKKHP